MKKKNPRVWSVQCSNGTILMIHEIGHKDKWGVHTIIPGDNQGLNSYQMYFMDSTFRELQALLNKILK